MKVVREGGEYALDSLRAENKLMREEEKHAVDNLAGSKRGVPLPSSYCIFILNHANSKY